MKTRMTVLAVLVAGLAIPVTARASIYSTTILGDNPVLYYRLDESSGTTANDSATSDGAQNGTYTGAYSLNQTGAMGGTDPSDTAVRFNPNPTDLKGYVDSTFVLTPTSAFTVEFWLKLPTLNDGHTEEDVLSQRNGGGLGRSIVYWDDVNQRMTSNLGGSSATDFWASSSGVSAGDYFYVAFVYDGAGNVTWYKNGVANGTISGVTPEAANGTVIIGDDKFLDGNPVSALNGTLDEFAIYDTALSSTQIADHFEAAPEPSSLTLAMVGVSLLWRRRNRSR